MPNTSPKCGLCNFIESLPAGQKKDRLLEDLQNGSNSSKLLEYTIRQLGYKTSASSVRRHRNELHSPNEVADPASPPTAKFPPTKAPPGWEEFSDYTDGIGSAIVKLPTPKATARDLLVTAGFNPDEWQISGPINTRRWMRYDQEWLFYYKFDVKAGESPEVVEQHVDELVSVIRSKRKAPTLVKEGTDAFAFFASDWQVGKKEGNDGTPETIERVLKSVDLAVERIKDLRRSGFKMPTLLFAGLGDLGEGTCGFYPGQQFLIDRNRRDQGRINRELITYALDNLTPLFDNSKVAVVGGNHGENRGANGKRITDDADNDDCAYFDAVREAFDRAGNHNISWDIMEDELSMAVNAGGVDVGLTHGHLFGSGNTAQKKAHEWWKSQDFGFQQIRGSRVLVTAHFHHFSCVCYGSRTHFQTPAMDPGSKWVRQAWGDDTPPGTLTMRLDATTALGWGDLSILHP